MNDEEIARELLEDDCFIETQDSFTDTETAVALIMKVLAEIRAETVERCAKELDESADELDDCAGICEPGSQDMRDAIDAAKVLRQAATELRSLKGTP